MKGGQDARRRGGYPSRVTGRAERAGRGDTEDGAQVASFTNLKVKRYLPFYFVLFMLDRFLLQIPTITYNLNYLMLKNVILIDLTRLL